MVLQGIHNIIIINCYYYIILYDYLIFLKRYAQFVPYSVVDGRKRLIPFKLNSDNSVAASLPHFWTSAGMHINFHLDILFIVHKEFDPNYAILVDHDTEDSCKLDDNLGPKSKDSNRIFFIFFFLNLSFWINDLIIS